MLVCDLRREVKPLIVFYSHWIQVATSGSQGSFFYEVTEDHGWSYGVRALRDGVDRELDVLTRETEYIWENPNSSALNFLFFNQL